MSLKLKVLVLGSSLLALALLAFWVVRKERGAPPPSLAVPDASGTDTSVQVMPPRLAAAPAPAPAPAPVPLGPPANARIPRAVPPVERLRVRIHGHVRGMDGGERGWHRPFVYAVTPAKPVQALARADVGADGAYSIEFTPESEAPLAIEVCARAPGSLPRFRNLMLAPGSEVELDFELSAGARIAGRVVTSKGEPVPAIELMLSSKMVLGMISRVQRVFATMNERAMLSPQADAYSESRCVTDANGYFSATGLAPGGYTVWTTSTEWFIRQTSRVTAGADSVEVVAEPALGFELRVVVRGAGTPVVAFDGLANIAAGPHRVGMPLSGTNGSEKFVWSQFEDEARTGLSVDFRVTADGFLPAVRRIDYSPGERFKIVEFQLERQPRGAATIRVVDAKGRPVELDLVVDLLSYPAKDERVPAIPLLRTPEPGRFRLETRSGMWLADVHPAHELGLLMKCPSELEIADRAEIVTRVMLPAFGSLKITRPTMDDSKLAVTVSVKSATGGGASVFLLEGAERTFPGIPIGAWIVKVVGGGLAEADVRVEVREDETSSVTLGAR